MFYISDLQFPWLAYTYLNYLKNLSSGKDLFYFEFLNLFSFPSHF